ncbi:hypothetical protein PTKIN_Ptkin02bG0251300 [Pterospermum kingtungense]
MSSKAKAEPESLNKPCLRNWLELPRNVTASILLRLGAIEIIESAQKVCTQWRDICEDPSMWRAIDMSNDDNSCYRPYDLERICMHAVDRSSGGLVDINIDDFGSDELITYIAQRTSNLRRLRLVFCDISYKGLRGAASTFPLLKELEIHFCLATITADIKVVGRCCPLLETFKYSRSDDFLADDDEALAIAQNMHGLRQLQLVGNMLTNRGLKAILDGCPYLETLDLRCCIYVDLEGDMGKRCAQQIKNLRRPHDSTHDYEFAALLDDGVEYSDYGRHLLCF